MNLHISMCHLEKGKIEDVDQILAIIESAKELLRSQNIDQWQDGYPDRDTVVSDIEAGNCYVLVYDGKIAAIGTICLGIDPDYTAIDGTWINSSEEEKYASLHRTAISNQFRGKGLSSTLILGLVKICREIGINDIRTDTHEDNKVMQYVLKKSGFEYRGIILQKKRNTLRLAYQSILA